jgi:(p)ppGpp synthase/HD superfamily hydrolase
MPEQTTTPMLSELFDDALKYASGLHRTQTRKGGDIPYVGHLLSVASLVIEGGGTQTQAIAGLLHDAVEDRGGPPTLAEIRARSGPSCGRGSANTIRRNTSGTTNRCWPCSSDATTPGWYRS